MCIYICTPQWGLAPGSTYSPCWTPCVGGYIFPNGDSPLTNMFIRWCPCDPQPAFQRVMC